MSSREEAMSMHPAGKGKVDVEEPVDETAEPEPYLLDSRDRCDGCGAQAYFRVYLEGGTLDFCNHHFQKFAPRLNAIEIRDESERLHDVS
jgi:hypothetical protein